MPTPTPPVPHGTTDEDICRYVAEMCRELTTVTRRPAMRTLRYLLDMARLEAERTEQALRKGSPER